MLPVNKIENVRRRANRARKFPHNTCPASRHVALMADALASGRRYAMFDEEPEHCAGSIYSVLESLWKLRTKTGWPDKKETEKMMKQAKFAITGKE